jgi:transposase-like protein
MMSERGLSLAHTTIMRWVKRFTPEFVERWNRFATAAGQPWRVDETYGTPSQRSPPIWG